MPKSKIIYQAEQEVFGKHIPSKQWILYYGKLTIYDRKTYPIVLKLKSKVYDSFLSTFLDDKKEIKGYSVSEVYGKLANWFNERGVLFRN